LEATDAKMTNASWSVLSSGGLELFGNALVKIAVTCSELWKIPADVDRLMRRPFFDDLSAIPLPATRNGEMKVIVPSTHRYRYFSRCGLRPRRGWDGQQNAADDRSDDAH